MTSSIEKSISRLSSRTEAVDRKIEAMSNALPTASAFGSARTDNLGDVMNAAAIDNLTGAAARLRALHSGADENPAAAGHNIFGKPASTPKVIDAEFTEINTAESDNGTA
jgi:hypothetical protein